MLAQGIRKLFRMGQLFISFGATAKPEATDTAPIQMAASASVEGVAMPTVGGILTATLEATGELSGVATPQPADTVNGAGKAAMALTMCGRPTNGALVYTRGQTGGELTMVGMPQRADTIEGAGAASASLKMLADPEAQGMANILAAAKGESSGFMMPKMQGVAQIMAGASGKLSMAALAFAKTLWDVAFSVNGTVEHETQALDGETVEDPVDAGIIEEPARETTPQFTYDYAGWALSEDGEVVGGGGSGDIVHLEETKYSGFALNAEFGAYAYDINPAPFVLILGETYTVVWDGTEYECTAQDLSAMIEGALALGNLAAFGGTGNNEPFAIGWTIYGVTILSFDTKEEHTVGIYQKASSDILPEQTLTFTDGLAVLANPIPFVAGETYKVVFDGEEYICNGQEVPAELGQGSVVGNAEPYGLAGNSEPFVAMYDAEVNESAIMLMSGSGTETHTIAIYQAGASESAGLPAITADTTFYAVFNATVRKYTANFYVNGVLESSQQVPYGEAATPPELTKGGYELSWEPSDLTVYGDTDFYGTWNEVMLASGSCGTNATYTLSGSGVLRISGTGAMSDFGQTSMPWYSYKDSVKSVVVEDGITSVGVYAFYQHANLTEVTLPEGLTTIKWDAFNKCSSLTSITIPSSVTVIGSRAFVICTSLETVNNLENCGITSVGQETFGGCSALKSIVLPGTVTKIWDAAFGNDTSLQSIYIPSSVTSILYFAFNNCTALTSATFETTTGWWYASTSSATSGTSISSSSLKNAATAATYLRSTYYNKCWFRS